MFGLLGVVSIIGTCVTLIKEACEPVVPAGNWANKDLIYKDRMNGVSEKQILKNVQNGKYKVTEVYPKPPKDPVTGQTIIQNSQLYYADVKQYGAYQASKWVQQGKYNLSPEELKKEHERLEKKWEYLYSLM